MMPRTEPCRQPHVYSGSLNQHTRDIYFALPDIPPISDETLEAISERHGLRAEGIFPPKDAVIFNAIYLVGGEYGPVADLECEPLHLDPSAGWC